MHHYPKSTEERGLICLWRYSPNFCVFSDDSNFMNTGTLDEMFGIDFISEKNIWYSQ